LISPSVGIGIVKAGSFLRASHAAQAENAESSCILTTLFELLFGIRVLLLSSKMATRCISKSCSQLSPSTSSSASRAFLQLTARRALHSTPLPLLEFLLPGFPSAIVRNGHIARPTPRTIEGVKRTFTTSSKRQQTTAIFNPRQDEDGNDMSVEITPRASNVRLTYQL
jgi:hypothetical protein